MATRPTANQNKPRVPVAYVLKARLHKGRAEIVGVVVHDPEEKTPTSAKVIFTLPGRAMKRNKNGLPLGLDAPDLGQRLEKAFQLAVKRATHP